MPYFALTITSNLKVSDYYSENKYTILKRRQKHTPG